MAFTLNHFTPRTMTENVNKVGNAQSNLLLQRVFRRRNTHPTATIDFGVLEGNVKISGYTRPGEPAVPVDKLTGSLKTITAPEIRLKKTLDRDFMNTLNPGMRSFMGPYTDPMSQVTEKLTEEQADLRAKIERQMEVTCADALLDGKATLTYPDGTTVEIDYEYVTTGSGEKTVQPALTGDAKWGTSTAKPLDFLRKLARLIYENSNYDGTLDVYMGWEAMDAFINDPQVKDALKTDMQAIATRSLAEQAMYRGSVGPFQFFEYVHSHDDSTGSKTATWDSKTIAVLPSNGDASVFSIEYGAVFEFPNPQAQTPQFIQTQFFSKLHRHDEPPVTDLILQANPVPLIKKPEAIRICKVL